MIYTPHPPPATGWAVIETERHGVHIMPVDEMDGHDFVGCRCEPREDAEYGIWTHQAFDGREKFENGERKPS